MAALSRLPELKCTDVSLRPITIIEDPESSCAAVTHSVSYSKCAPRTPVVVELNHRMAARSRELADYNEARSDARNPEQRPRKRCDVPSIEVSGDCDVPYQNGPIISVQCRRTWSGVRSGGSQQPFNFDTSDGTLRDIQLKDILVESARDTFWQAVRKDLIEQDVADEETELTQPAPPDFYFTSKALVIDFSGRFGRKYVTVDLPYSALQGMVKTKYLPRTPPSNLPLHRTSAVRPPHYFAPSSRRAEAAEPRNIRCRIPLPRFP